MNPVKIRISTKTITTLLVASSVLVGLMTISLPDAALATHTPQHRPQQGPPPTPSCPEDEPEFVLNPTTGECERTLTDEPECPPRHPPNAAGQCVNPANQRTHPPEECDEDAGFFFNEESGLCEKPENVPSTCPSGFFVKRTEEGLKCQRETPGNPAGAV